MDTCACKGGLLWIRIFFFDFFAGLDIVGESNGIVDLGLPGGSLACHLSSLNSEGVWIVVPGSIDDRSTEFEEQLLEELLQHFETGVGNPEPIIYIVFQWCQFNGGLRLTVLGHVCLPVEFQVAWIIHLEVATSFVFKYMCGKHGNTCVVEVVLRSSHRLQTGAIQRTGRETYTVWFADGIYLCRYQLTVCSALACSRTKYQWYPGRFSFFSSWLATIFKKTGGALLMNGFTLDDPQHELQLSSFWELYKNVMPNHAVYTTHHGRLHRVIPMYYHGDEGRGKLHRPVLVTSYVAGLPVAGHTFLPRFLASVFPGERYAVGPDGTETLEAIHGELARDLVDLFTNGFSVLGLACLCCWFLLMDCNLYIEPRLQKKTDTVRRCILQCLEFVEIGLGKVTRQCAFFSKCCFKIHFPSVHLQSCMQDSGYTSKENVTYCVQVSHPTGSATFVKHRPDVWVLGTITVKCMHVCHMLDLDQMLAGLV